MHDHATDGGRGAFQSKAGARELRLHLDNAHDTRTSGLDFLQLIEMHVDCHDDEDARLAREAAANLLADRLAAAPPAVVEAITADDACPDDPDGQHHVGCGCDEPDQPAPAQIGFRVYLTDGNGTLYLAEPVDPRHMPAAGPLYRLSLVAGPEVDILDATKASLAASAAWLATHQTSGTPQPPDRPGGAEPAPAAAALAPPAAPSSEGAGDAHARPAPSGPARDGGGR